MKTIILVLTTSILLFLGCEKNTEIMPLKSKVKTIKNDLGNSSIRVYYDNDLIRSIVMINATEDVVSLVVGGYADSIVWHYKNDDIDYGISYKRRDIPAPYYYWGYQIDTVSTNKIYLIRDSMVG
ncbi:MAG: hypothetical protein HC896_14170 [Bacteroidales bacterium]|nr:hypothetical protein [Bacteroidales bacterium]